MKLFLRSLIFYIGLVTSLVLFAPVFFLSLFFPYRQRYYLLALWPKWSLWWLAKTCHLTYELRGQENLPSTAAIIFSNHQSAWETLAAPALFPMQTWVLKRELLWIPVFGWGLAVLKPIAIQRKNIHRALQQMVEQGQQRLAEGVWIIVFPEGTRVALGEKKRYRVGGALLAAKSAYPLVPIAHNAGTFWPRQGFIKRPGTIQVVIGPVIECLNKDYKEINELAEQWIESTLLTLKEKEFL